MGDYKRDPEKFRRLFKETKDTADKVHQHYTEGAKFTGYILDRLDANEQYWETLVDYSPDDTGIDMTVGSGEVFLRSYNQQLNNLYNQLPDHSGSLITLASSWPTFPNKKKLNMFPALLIKYNPMKLFFNLFSNNIYILSTNSNETKKVNAIALEL